MSINLKPTHADLTYIENWLFEEYRIGEGSFYSNWNLILDSYKSDELAVFYLENKPVGFLTWHDSHIYRNVEIMSIQPKLRQKGFGRAFIREFVRITQDHGILAMRLFCSPQDSQHFWRKVDFVDIHKGSLIDHEIWLYKPLIDIAQNTNKEPLNKLELWDEEPIRVDGNKKPYKVWDLSELSKGKPILEVCSFDWKLRWTYNKKVQKEGKVKYFQKNRTRFEYAPFLYLTQYREWDIGFDLSNTQKD